MSLWEKFTTTEFASGEDSEHKSKIFRRLSHSILLSSCAYAIHGAVGNNAIDDVIGHIRWIWSYGNAAEE